MNNKQNPFKEQNLSYREDEWVRALNKQGYLNCCQLINSMKAYINTYLNVLSEAEQDWFCRFSWCFLTALKGKINFCKECLEFYGRLKNSVVV